MIIIIIIIIVIIIVIVRLNVNKYLSAICPKRAIPGLSSANGLFVSTVVETIAINIPLEATKWECDTIAI